MHLLLYMYLMVVPISVYPNERRQKNTTLLFIIVSLVQIKLS